MFCKTAMWAFTDANNWDGLIGGSIETSACIELVNCNSNCCAKYSRGENTWSATTICLSFYMH